MNNPLPSSYSDDVGRLRAWFYTYLVVLVIGFYATFTSRSPESSPGLYVLLLAIVPYAVSIVYAYRVQRALNVAGLYRHGAWQVVVGALIFNPFFIGLLIPASVLWVAGRATRQTDTAGGTRIPTVATEEGEGARMGNVRRTSSGLGRLLSPPVYILAFLLLVMLVGYDLLAHRSQPDLCPASLRGEPSSSESGIQWSNKIEATITRVAVECIPIHASDVTEGTNKQSASTSYQLPTTANVAYKIVDSLWFKRATAYTDLNATIVFEAVSASGVVLASGYGQFKVVDGNNSGTVSTTLTVPEPMIGRVSAVRAGWQYGRF